ncbi:polysaccharide biosynthesis/export family protein [Burkholderia pseudomallei]|uniref:polysaccharide biosynthesis/export family protein n=1 Tax=Burkholderia pseudomallei TaxID=28450 RepID=UPI0009CD076C|nr:SLBB domain-containing protein [Burkholderia pseudomallei]OMQ61967.1 capsule biosynthesis protein [Burkholderia pseudomallei]OMQ69620.1 capsule biosynthesis protein [Burkholderia pseudomallei]OMQ81083.1 capsule biosynthesis protein [Burkholderia pseudomallei]
MLAWLLRCAACLGPCAFPVFAHAQIVPFVPSASAGADARSAVPLPPIDGLPAADGLSVRQRDALQPPLPGAKLTKDATTKDGLLKDGAALNEPPRPCGPLGCRGEAIDCPPSADGRPTSITRRADGTPELPDPCGRPRAASQPALTDFQVFVQQSTGRALPLFGYNFFSTTTTYRSLDNVPVPDDYVLGPGDEVLLHAWGGVAGDQRLVVDRNGQVSIPGVGVVTVAGARASELDSLLRGGLGRYFTDFNVNAALGRLRSIPVYVVGKAMSPGSYTVPGTSTIIGALFASGGPAFNGSMRAVALYRNGRQIAALDVYGFLTRGAVKDDVHLLPGDVIVIPPAGPRVALTGALDAPGIYELRKTSETLRELLDDAGGVTALTSLDRVMIERVNPADGAAPRSVQEVRLDEAGLATVVKDGDIVTLSMVSQKFSNAVTLRGNVAAALRYPYKPGMTLADLLPSPEAVLTPDYFTRKNILVEYAKSGGADRRPFDGIRNLVDEPNWHYAIIQRLDPVTLTENVIAFNLRAVMTKGSAEAGIALQPGDVVTIFGKRDLRNPVDDNKSLVRVDGEVRAPGVYQLNAGESLRELLQRAGGLTSNAYVFGLEFTRESTRSQQQNLNAALDRATLQANSKLAAALANLPSGDTQYLQAQMAAAQQAQLARLRELKPTGRVSLELSTRASRIGDLPDLPLNDGDAIYVPPVPAFVTVYGAVDNQNAVIWKLHRTVADTLRVAGVQRDIADLDAAFVLRADGSVASASSAGWFGSFGALELMPGDALVVPEKLDRRTAMTKFLAGLKDWSQVLANFGLGAAAIKVLK